MKFLHKPSGRSFFRLCCILLVVFSGELAGQERIQVGPEYTIDMLLTDLGNPKGQRFEFSMPLSESKYFRGDDPTLDPEKPVRKSRKVYVYIPAEYEPGTKAPVLLTLDGPSHFSQICNALDNLTILQNPDRKLPAFVLVSVENGGGNAKGSQRGLEYDTMSDRFAGFISNEVLPAVLNNEEIRKAFPGIAFTDDPLGRAIMGCSSGGAAAFTAGWFKPDLFSRIISYSGTFVDQQDDDADEESIYPLGAWEYHSGMKLIENSEKKALRIFLQVSENDLGKEASEDTHHNWVMANERMTEALANKGYEFRYLFSLEAGHCDANVFDQTLAETLIWIWQGYDI